MKKVMRTIGRIIMEIATNAFIWMLGCFVCDVLYEYTSWRIGQDWGSAFLGAFVLFGSMVIRYQVKRKTNDYLEQINPKIERVAGMLNQINESSKEDKVA